MKDRGRKVGPECPSLVSWSRYSGGTAALACGLMQLSGVALEKSKAIVMQIVLETLLESNSGKHHTWPFSAAHVLLMRISILRQLGFERGHGHWWTDDFSSLCLMGHNYLNNAYFLLLQFSGTLMSL